MSKHFLLLYYLLLHKWYVLVEACKLGIPGLGLVHDLSKFSRTEWSSYADQFFGSKNCAGFPLAWEHHWKHNKHHWQYWDGKFMPSRYCREMLADWIGAGKAQGKSDVETWYSQNSEKMNLHPETRYWIEAKLKGRKKLAPR